MGADDAAGLVLALGILGYLLYCLIRPEDFQVTGTHWAHLIVYVVLITIAAGPLGSSMAAVFEGGRTLLHPVLQPVEHLVFRVASVHQQSEQTWYRYAVALLGFHVLGFAMLDALLRLQGSLPLHAEGLPGMSPGLAFNTAASFVANTNWQAYSGEASPSYLSQMLGLTF